MVAIIFRQRLVQLLRLAEIRHAGMPDAWRLPVGKNSEIERQGPLRS
jgi:hypothetical protein